MPRSKSNPLTGVRSTIDQVIGTHIPDTDAGAGTAAWVQAECRTGSLAEAIAEFAAAQPERPDPARTIVDTISADRVICHIPTMVVDRESPHPFRVDVDFEVCLPAGKVTRIPDPV